MVRTASDQQHIRLYQVSFTQWGAPVIVAAPTFGEAADLAARGRTERGNHSGMIVMDVTDEFDALSDQARAHTQALVSRGERGVVDYDDDEGWQVR